MNAVTATALAAFDAVDSRPDASIMMRQVADILQQVVSGTTRDQALDAALTRSWRPVEQREYAEQAPCWCNRSDLLYALGVLNPRPVHPREGYVNVDSVLLQLGARRDFDNPHSPDLGKIRNLRGMEQLWDASSDGAARSLGVVKRLFAALSSASARGGVGFHAEPIGSAWTEENGPGTETSQRVRITISDTGGIWSGRAYKMVTVATVTMDEWGVHGWSASRGTARVTGRREGADATIFGGYAVGQAIASLYFGWGLARNAITGWCTRPAPEQPDWLGALAQLVESIATDAGDPSGAVAFARAVGDGLADDMAQDVLREFGLRCGDRLADAIRSWMPNPQGDLRDAIDGHAPAEPGAVAPGYDNCGELVDAAVNDVRTSARVADMSDAEVKAVAETVAASVATDPQGRQLVVDLDTDRSDLLAVIAETRTGYRVIVNQRYASADGDPIGYALHLDYPRQGCSVQVAYLDA